MAASGSIAIKVEPEDTSSSIFPGNHDGLEEFITDDYPSNTLFQSESTLVKEEAQDTMVSPLRGNQANGDEFINDDNQGHSGSNTARDSTQKRRKMLCPNTNPRKPCYSRRKSSKAHCRLLRKKRRLKAHATIGDSQADTLQLSDGALEESLFTRDLSMARDCTEVEGSEHRPLETPPGATTVRSAVTYIKEEPHDARHFPSHGTSGNAEVVAETVMVPSDFFCVKEEPSSPLPGNDEDIDELLMSDQTEAEISSSGFISIKEEPQCSSSSVPPDTWIHESIEDLITDNRPAVVTRPPRGGNRCIVPECKHHSLRNREVSWHYFPKENAARELWIQALVQDTVLPEPWKPKPSYKLCGAHFNSCGKRQYMDKVPRFLKPGTFMQAAFGKNSQNGSYSLLDVAVEVSIETSFEGERSVRVPPVEVDANTSAFQNMCGVASNT
ncbi:uncharacterized protein LOC135371405 isoform X7 [Ornithodoros turicata]|uniref:uncharacterized protein LOC135371405 isoform X7 n=1 Tax=Ornithodoros turicata TaxID=34597 RepID=UPI003139CC1A